MVENAFGFQAIDPIAQAGAAFGFHEVVVGGAIGTTGAPQPPLPHEQGAFIQKRQVVGQREAFDNPGSPERWGGHGSVGRDVATRGNLHGSCGSFAFSGNPAGSLMSGLALQFLFLGCGVDDQFTTFGCHDVVHQTEALERVPGVVHITLIHIGEVVFHIGTGQRGAAQQHGNVRCARSVHFLQVFLHDHRGFHQQTGHAHYVSIMVANCGNNGGNGLLNSQVHNLIAVIG